MIPLAAGSSRQTMRRRQDLFAYLHVARKQSAAILTPFLNFLGGCSSGTGCRHGHDLVQASTAWALILLQFERRSEQCGEYLEVHMLKTPESSPRAWLVRGWRSVCLDMCSRPARRRIIAMEGLMDGIIMTAIFLGGTATLRNFICSFFLSLRFYLVHRVSFSISVSSFSSSFCLPTYAMIFNTTCTIRKKKKQLPCLSFDSIDANLCTILAIYNCCTVFAKNNGDARYANVVSRHVMSCTLPFSRLGNTHHLCHHTLPQSTFSSP